MMEHDLAQGTAKIANEEAARFATEAAQHTANQEAYLQAAKDTGKVAGAHAGVGVVAAQRANQRRQRKQMEAAQNWERQQHRAAEAMNTHERGVGGASTTTGLSNLASPNPQVQGF